MRTFLINNKRYVAKEFTFGAVRQLESNGLSLTDVQNKPMTLAAAYLAFCAGINMDAADNEIQEHVINGGNLDGIFEAVTEAMNDSRFFQALNKKAEAQEVQDIPVVPVQEIPGQAVPIQAVTATPVGESVIQ
ncbi:hypothetical protein [Pseudobutyrivibrio sp.]|uniref:hypothetical protein n=1 Tax=Pseudobutyrivibrio sp. TaxID=2014367 RepID=UPI00386CA05E